MVDLIKRHWVLFAVLGLLYSMVAAVLTISMAQNQGHFVYPVDDVYIHMAMAKNFARHGVWGVSPYGFNSTSSSLLWTMLLSLTYMLFGVREAIPLLMNIAVGTLTILVLYVILKQHGYRSKFIFGVLVAVLFLTPLVTLIFLGLEHVLHTLVTVVFVYVSARVLCSREMTFGENVLLMATALLLPLIRYEGLFPVVVVCLLLLVKKKPVYAIFLGTISVLPLAIYGTLAVAKGWYFLPNSVLLKGSTPTFSSLKGIVSTVLTGYWQVVQNPHIMVLVIVALAALYFQVRRGKSVHTPSVVMLTIFLAITYLHMQFAKTGWVYRYEAYLVCLGLFAVSMAMPARLLPERYRMDRKTLPERAVVVLLVLFMGFPFVFRGAHALAITPRATTNIYEQQYQMALFLREYYQGQSVAANDIGAITFLSDIRCLDLWGLASMEVASAKKERLYDTQKIDEIAKAKDVKVAVLYDDWYDEYGGLPSSWSKVGEWQILNNKVCGGDTVSFYAVDPKERDALISHLRQFSSRLPMTVVQRGEYTE